MKKTYLDKTGMRSVKNARFVWLLISAFLFFCSVVCPVPVFAQPGARESGSMTGVPFDPATGAKVAVIDISFNGLLPAISRGELPGNMVLLDCTGTGCMPATFASEPSETEDRGTGVSRIAHTMAPDAKLYAIKVLDASDKDGWNSLAGAAAFCRNNGVAVTIINQSAGDCAGNFFRDECYTTLSSPVYSANTFSSDGIRWVNDAGTFVKKHYGAKYSDPENAGWHSVIPALDARKGDRIQLWLTWDAWPATNQDFDLYLWDGLTGFPEYICAGMERQTGAQPPREYCSGIAPEDGTYYVKIQKTAARTNPKFDLYSSHELKTSVVVPGRKD